MIATASRLISAIPASLFLPIRHTIGHCSALTDARTHRLFFYPQVMLIT